MNTAGSHIEFTISSLRRWYGTCSQFGHSKRLFQFGNLFTCSINFSRELRGPKYFYGLSREVLDPLAPIPATLHGHFVLLVCGNEDTVLWLPRSIILHAMRGVESRRLDVFQEDGRFILQTTGHSKRNITQFVNARPVQPNEVSEQKDPQSKGRSHSEIQIGLAKLGRAEGCKVWVPPNDRHIRWREESLHELTCDRLPNFGFDEGTRRVVSNIDVLWLDGNVIKRAFEVESTTTIYSGLLRLNDLVLAQPNNRIELVITADSERKARVLGQIARPTFCMLAGQCAFVSFAQVRDAVEQVDRLRQRGVTRVQGLLNPEVLTLPNDPDLKAIDLRS